MSKNFFVYDGRANYDVDDAVCMECFEANTEKQAKRYFKRHYRDMDAVLMDQKDKLLMTSLGINND